MVTKTEILPSKSPLTLEEENNERKAVEIEHDLSNKKAMFVNSKLKLNMEFSFRRLYGHGHE